MKMKMNKRSEQIIAIAFSIFVFASITASLFIPMGEGKTIILQTPSGTDSCVVDFVLAQNLTDLCDVTIISPSNGQIVRYNGSQWVNVASSIIEESTVCNNVGSGTIIICAGGNVNLKKLLGGTGITLSQNSTNIMINATGDGSESTVCTNVGSGSEVYKDGNCNFRTLIGSSDISVTENANDITIDYNGTLVSESTVCIDTGTGNGLCNGGNVQIKSLIAGTSITISDTTDDYTIINSAPEITACNNVGTGNQLCSGGNVNLDTLIAGTGITISDTTDDWTFASQCTNTGTGEPVCESANNINSLIAGTGITIADTTGDLTITNTVTDTNACTNTGTGEAVCESANNINSLIAGNGITIADTTGDLTISSKWELLCSNSGTGASLSCSSFAGRTNLYVEITAVSNSGGTAIVPAIQFNSDGGTNYSWRTRHNSSADVTGVSDIECNLMGTNSFENSGGGIISFNIENIASIRKMGFSQMTHGLGTSDTNAPNYVVGSCKWDNSTDQITTITLLKVSGTNNYDTGTQITVWGHN